MLHNELHTFLWFYGEEYVWTNNGQQTNIADVRFCTSVSNVWWGDVALQHVWLCRGSPLGWRHISLFGLPYISSTTIKYSTSSNTGTRQKRGWKPQTGREFQHQRILKLIFLPDKLLHCKLVGFFEAPGNVFLLGWRFYFISAGTYMWSWVFFCPQICDVPATQAADEPSQQRGRTQGQFWFSIKIMKM